MFRRILTERLKHLSDERLMMVAAYWRAYKKTHIEKENNQVQQQRRRRAKIYAL